MVLKQLIQTTLQDIVAAQYDAYLYSMELKGKQDDDALFPIPMARATEVTIDLKYAYMGEPVESIESVLDKKQFLQELEKATSGIVQQGIASLVDYTEDNGKNTPENWPEMKKGLKGSALTNYAVNQIMDALKKDYTGLVNEHNVFNKKQYKKTVADHFDKAITNHPDLKELNYSVGDKQLIKNNLPGLDKKAQELEKSVTGKISQRLRRDAGIVVDSELLKTLPEQSIQQMKLTLDMRELEEIKVGHQPQKKQS